MKHLDTRPAERIRDHYELEKRLAARLMNSTFEERRSLYREVYDEMYRRFPSDSQLAKRAEPDLRADPGGVLALVERHLKPGMTFVELGAGDCRISIEVAKTARQVYAVDVSAQIHPLAEPPPNFKFVLSDGFSIDIEPGSVDLIMSHHMIEHVHPDDIPGQFETACRVLKPGGQYICVSPHRYSGPHDISKHFDEVATGFHLHEYISSELTRVMRSAGFSRVRQVAGARGHFVTLPVVPVIALEKLVGLLPYKQRRALSASPGVSALFERLVLIGIK